MKENDENSSIEKYKTAQIVPICIQAFQLNFKSDKFPCMLIIPS